MRPIKISFVLFILLLLLASCSSPMPDSHTITLSNPSPATLDVVLQIAPNPNGANFFGDHANVQIAALFFETKKAPMDTSVLFSNNETMTCNGKKLTRSTSNNDVGVNPAFSGEFYQALSITKPVITCTYNSPGTQVVIAYPLQPAVAILTPKDGSKAQRSKNLKVTYSSPHVKNESVLVMADIRYPGKFSWNPFDNTYIHVFSTPQSGTGTCQVDLTRVHASSAGLTLSYEYDSQITDSPFHSLTVSYSDESFEVLIHVV